MTTNMAAVLKEALENAAEAHHEFEAALGHADDNWPEWYANHMLDALSHDGIALVDLNEEEE